MFIIAYNKDNYCQFEGPAISEYEEAFHRYTFLCQQLDFIKSTKYLLKFGDSTKTLDCKINKDRLDYLTLFEFGCEAEPETEIIDFYFDL